MLCSSGMATCRELSCSSWRQLAMQRPLSDVMGVASFYHLFRLVPPPLHRCVVCRGTACFVRGAERLEAGLRRRGVAFETASCVGACGQAPVLVLDGTVGCGDSGALPEP